MTALAAPVATKENPRFARRTAERRDSVPRTHLLASIPHKTRTGG